MAPGEPDQSPVFAYARALDAGVSIPRERWALGVGVAVAALLGLVVFASLAAERDARRHAAQHARQIAAARPMLLATAPPPMAPTVPSSPGTAVITPPPALTAHLPAASAVDPIARWRLPAVVVDFSGGRDGEAAPAVATPGNPVAASGLPAGDDKLSGDERFAARIGATEVETATASRLANPSRVAPQGTVIPAILETAIDSDLPGFARAVVSRDVRGFDGARVLIPKGSKLVGQYRSGVADGQSRVFVIWSRVLTPEGISIDIASPGADPQGRGGLTGEVNTHFFRRFGASILLSVLSGGIDAAAAAASQGGTTAIVIGSPVQASNLAQVALQKQINIGPTIKVAQGEPIRVFVARDLDFSTVAAP
jgi:type IV secretory pathway VirB10-like protein